MKKILFGAGCFWGVQEAFRHLEGVVETKVGYSGGNKKNPKYSEVCTGLTGHAEVVKIAYDEEKVQLSKLLETFWSLHDPTSLNKQGPDKGTQYRSCIFYYDEKQKEIIETSLKENQAKYTKPIVTEVSSAKAFYPAEEYHQCYLMKKGLV